MRSANLLERYGPPAGAGVGLPLAWQFLPGLLGISRLLIPPPSTVVVSLWTVFQRGLLVENFLITLFETLAGFVLGSLAAVFWAFVITPSPLPQPALMPYLVGFQALPKVALAPLIVVWIGIGIESKVAI